MLLNRSPSWRQRSWPQPVNAVQDFGEQPSGDSDLCELECDGAAVAHDLGTDLDEFLTQRGERPVLCFLRYGRLLLWVISRLHGHCVDTSAIRAEADVIGEKADVEIESLLSARERKSPSRGSNFRS